MGLNDKAMTEYVRNEIENDYIKINFETKMRELIRLDLSTKEK